METSTVAILLYSKYSQRCKEFLDEADDELGLRVLCIDNNEIREMITKDKNGYHIKNVPCVFVLYSNGRLEKYEGSDAFVWLRKVRDVLKTSPSDAQPHQQQQPQQQQQIDDINNGGDVGENDPDDPQKRTEALIEKELSMRQSADQMLSRKTLNIKEVAQMMQQQRETDEERMNPPPPGGPLRS
jgi:hypothetical protein